MATISDQFLSPKAKRLLALAKLKQKAIDNNKISLPQDAIDDPETWQRTVFPKMDLKRGGERHKDLWGWINDIPLDSSPDPFIAIWPRGSGKSTSAELAATYLGATRKRKYVWYVSSTQALADLHVDSVAALIESNTFAQYYPTMASRKLNKFGTSKGWRRNRLRCGNGFTIDSLGLDVAVRGAKIEEQRPDLIILDDIDDAFASLSTIRKRIEIITSSVLPAGAPNLAILGVQNLIRNDGFFGRIVQGNNDYLLNAIVSGPHPAVINLETSVGKDGESGIRVTGGVATWPEGQPLEVVEKQISDWGLTAFKREAQHEVSDTGSLFEGVDFHFVDDGPNPSDLLEVIVCVDPAVSSTDKSDSHGLCVGGKTEDEVVWLLEAIEKVMSPTESFRKSILLAVKYGARTVHVEDNNGGDYLKVAFNRTVGDMIRAGEITRNEAPIYEGFKATASMGNKVKRAHTLLADMERDNVRFVREKTKDLVDGMNRFPQTKPYDGVDAAVHCHRILSEGFTSLFL